MSNDDATKTAAGTGAGAAAAGTDHRKRPRRRGDALNAAIFQATLEELAEVGYAGLTMEGVAERARASKASLYRRWPGKTELVMDSVYHVMLDPETAFDTGSLRGDLLAMLHEIAERLSGPEGQGMRGLLSDALRDPARAAELRTHSRGHTRRTVREILRRAGKRGEVDAEAITDRQVEVGPALLRYHFLTGGTPIPEEIITGIVDEVVLPLFRTGEPA